MKRLFDFVFSLFAIFFFGWLIALLSILAFFDTGKGLFLQARIGQFGRPFTIYKICTLHSKNNNISGFGTFLRKSKLDELPQLFNILKGEMSFVGPRPDIPGYYDKLKGEDRKILELKPGLCSEAAIKYYNEDAILAKQENALQYNNTMLFPDKVKMNLEYYYNRSFIADLNILWRTVFGRPLKD